MNLSWTRKWPWAAGVLAAFVVAIGVLAGTGGAGPESTAAPWPAEVSQVTVKLASERSNAVAMARDYLEISGFSRSGLIDQLEYEGFSTSDATAAVNQLEADGEVDWYEQAARTARSYREISPFSRKGLIEQLEYEGFTYQQAVYGADHS
ncbi:hypothetical protein GP2_045_00250 [Gordonia paraffinivorans NBRC 108238]|uniref:Putative host cell surface-exposed lipoprotein Ltp-like HTH region domain-containing protein n=1 Tax=Gordonia paraffinivorans NBRC 108238 TaxID=1223543 RepID=A0ABQ0IQX4_9ACTN|nr:Ltp family lipoprotein [Gordonia paraffinivorans]GAC85910.1 hypothetical protein GP2_045_00250 [Gordonia paraffinivorans NBRC 108238]